MEGFWSPAGDQRGRTGGRVVSAEAVVGGRAGPAVDRRGAVRGVRQCAEGCARVVTQSPVCAGAAYGWRDVRAVQPELEASVWGRRSREAGVLGGRTRNHTLGRVDWTSEEPGTGATCVGAPPGQPAFRKGQSQAVPRDGTTVLSCVLAGSSGSVYFFNVFNCYFSCLNWCLIN